MIHNHEPFASHLLETVGLMLLSRAVKLKLSSVAGHFLVLVTAVLTAGFQNPNMFAHLLTKCMRGLWRSFIAEPAVPLQKWAFTEPHQMLSNEEEDNLYWLTGWCKIFGSLCWSCKGQLTSEFGHLEILCFLESLLR